MSHLYDQVVKAVATSLAGLATTGPRVFVDKDHPLADDEVNGLVVTELQDRVVQTSANRPRILTIDLLLIVSIKAKAPTSADGNAAAVSRQILLEVVQRLFGPTADVTLGGIAKFISYGGSDRDPDEENQDVVTRHVTIVARLQTRETSFEVSA